MLLILRGRQAETKMIYFSFLYKHIYLNTEIFQYFAMVHCHASKISFKSLDIMLKVGPATSFLDLSGLGCQQGQWRQLSRYTATLPHSDGHRESWTEINY